MSKKDSNLLSEAIADANAMRDMALKNAEEILKESFQSQLQSLVSKQLEMDDPEEDDDEYEDKPSDEATFRGYEGDDSEEEDSEEETDEPIGDEEIPSGDEEEDEDERSDEEIELEDIIRELEAQIAEAEKEMGGDEEEDEYEEGKKDDDDDKEEMEENSDSSKIGGGDNKMPDAKASSSSASEDPEKLQKNSATNSSDLGKPKEGYKESAKASTLDELLEEFFGEGDKEEDDDEDKKDMKDEGRQGPKVAALEAQLEEAIKTVKVMKSALNETNLLNSKLLYSNKIFKSFSLNEKQKMKVIETFDRAQNVRETKIIYSTLVESFSAPARRKRSVNEGSVSKPVGATKPIIKEASDIRTRFMHLAKLNN
jgi:hypothetical protein